MQSLKEILDARNAIINQDSFSEATIKEIISIYKKYEHVLEKSGGWPGYTAFYNPQGDDDILLNKVTVNLSPSVLGLCRKEEEDEYSEPVPMPSDTKLSELLEEEIRDRFENHDDFVRGVKRYLLSKLPNIPKYDNLAVLNGKSDYVNYIKENVLIPLEKARVEQELPKFDIRIFGNVDAAFTDEEGHEYPECLHLNIELRETMKLSLRKDGVFKFEGTIMNQPGYSPEYIVLQAIEELKEWKKSLEFRGIVPGKVLKDVRDEERRKELFEEKSQLIGA